MSMNKKHGLGRGLEALLGDDDLTFNLDNINAEGFFNAGTATLKIDDVIPSP